MIRFWLFIRFALLWVVLLSLVGCGNGKNAVLYKALPINTDGNPTGNIVLVEFLDYANANCIKMAPIINEVMEKRPNVRVIYHLVAWDPQKEYLTKMVLAAGLQDRFLAAHYLMINRRTKLTKKQAISLLSQAFIDTNELTRQAEGTEVRSMILTNNKLAKAWGVSSIPSFFIGRMNHKPQVLTGLPTLPELLAAIDEEASK